MITFFKNLFKPSADLTLLVKQGALVVDVRTLMEYKSGHISGSKNIPLNSLKNDVQNLRQLNKPIITVCQSGGRSSMAKSILQSAGLEVYNGGGWRSLQNKIQ